MDLMRNIDEKRGLLVGGVITICIAMLAVTARRVPTSFDVFWHLQTGLDWLKHGMSPWVDHYSFTFNGNPITGSPAIFQASIAWFVDRFGLEHGLQLFKFATFIAILGLVLFFLRRLRSRTYVYLLILPLLVVLIQLRSMARPELISYGLSVIAVILYHRAAGRINFRSMWPIIFLMVVWNNYHTAILGYVIFFGLFVDALWLQYKEKASAQTWLKWFIWGVVIVAVGFLNPSFNHPVIGQLSFAPEWKQLIQEYAPTSSLYRNLLPAYVLLAVTLATLALAVFRRKWGFVIVVGVLFYNSISMSRLVTPSGIIVICIFASLLSELRFSEEKGAIARLSENTVATLSIIVLLTSFYFGVNASRTFMLENSIAEERYPFGIVNYMKENGIGGRIFNEYQAGGYLTYHLSPESQVYIDGRTNILYPLEHHARYLKVRNNSVEMTEEFEKYGVDVAVLADHQSVHSVIHNTGLMKLDFVDAQFALFVRENARFPISGRLLAYPACWKQEMLPALEGEQNFALWKLPRNSALLPYLDAVIRWSKSEKPDDTLVELKETPLQYHHVAKFATYQALSTGRYQDAIDFIRRYNNWDLGDFIAFAIASIKLDRYEEAERVLDEATYIPWPNVTPGQTILLYRTVQKINLEHGLQLISDDYLEQLKQNVLNMGESTNELALSTQLFCNE